MSDEPPAGFVEFVIARGPALHRTALLLTGREQAAEDLVQIALAKAWPTWAGIDRNHEASVRRIIINEFAPAWRRPRRGVLPRADLPTLHSNDHGDDDANQAASQRQVLMAGLAALPPRQRCVLVLGFLDDYTESAIAEAMGTRIGTVRSRTATALATLNISEGRGEEQAPDLFLSSQERDAPMKRTLDDLRTALHQVGDDAAYPDVDALLAGARGRVAATGRRRRAALGSVTVAVVVVGGLAATRSPDPLPQPPVPRPFTLNNGGAGFPEYSQGMKRLTALDAPMLAQLNDTITVATTPGRRLAVAMTCTPADDMEKLNEWITRIQADFTLPGRSADRPTCAVFVGQGYSRIGIATAATTTILADVAINHDPSPGLDPLFQDAQIHVAIYESVPWGSYPFPPRPADLDTNPEHDMASDPGSVRVLGPRTARDANKTLTFTQPFDPNLSLSLQSRGPGRMRVLINGRDVSKLIGDTMQTQDGSISFWEYSSRGLSFPLDHPSFAAGGFSGSAEPAAKPGTPVTVTIIPRDFIGPDWQVEVVRQAPSGD